MKIGTGATMGLAGGMLALGTWWWAMPHEVPRPVAPAVALPAAPRMVPMDAPAALLAPATLAARPLLRSPERFARWLADDSSLRGVALDGAWDVDASGHLRPTVALRRRFDQLLTLAGEAKVDEIGAYIEHEVSSAHGAAAAREVSDAWQRYLALQRHVFTTRPDPKDRSTLQAALAERQLVRSSVLGPALAAAFFADEEARLQAQLLGDTSAEAGAQSIHVDRASLDPAALARVQQADAEWADWQRRLDAARQELARLQAAPELSDPQRRDAIDRLIAGRFRGTEAIRARALMGLPMPEAPTAG